MRTRIGSFLLALCSCLGGSVATSIRAFGDALGWPLSSANLIDATYTGAGYGLFGGIIVGVLAVRVKRSKAALALILGGGAILAGFVFSSEFILVRGIADM